MQLRRRRQSQQLLRQCPVPASLLHCLRTEGEEGREAVHPSYGHASFEAPSLLFPSPFASCFKIYDQKHFQEFYARWVAAAAAEPKGGGLGGGGRAAAGLKFKLAIERDRQRQTESEWERGINVAFGYLSGFRPKNSSRFMSFPSASSSFFFYLFVPVCAHPTSQKNALCLFAHWLFHFISFWFHSIPSIYIYRFCMQVLGMPRRIICCEWFRLWDFKSST